MVCVLVQLEIQRSMASTGGMNASLLQQTAEHMFNPMENVWVGYAPLGPPSHHPCPYVPPPISISDHLSITPTSSRL